MIIGTKLRLNCRSIRPHIGIFRYQRVNSCIIHLNFSAAIATDGEKYYNGLAELCARRNVWK